MIYRDEGGSGVLLAFPICPTIFTSAKVDSLASPDNHVKPIHAILEILFIVANKFIR